MTSWPRLPAGAARAARAAGELGARHPHLAALAAALFAALAALAFLALLPAAVAGNDSADYADFYRPVALSLLEGKGLVDEGRLADRYPPGFPALLAAAIGAGRALGLAEETAVGLLGLLGFAATAAALFRLGLACHGALAGWLAAGAFALYPPHLFLVKQPNSELVFLPLLLLALELAWRSRSGQARLAFAAGALLGAGALVRPIALLLFVPLGVFLVVFAAPGTPRARRLALAAALAAGQLLAMAPWTIALHQATGRFVPLSSGGRLSMLDGLTIGAKKGREGPPLPARVTALMREIDGARPELRSPGAIFAFLGRKAREEPATVAQLALIKVARSFYATDSLRFEGLLLAIQLPLLLLGAAALAFAWRRREEPWRPLAALTILMLLYFLAMTVLVLSILRYLVPAMALLLLAIVAAAAEALGLRESGRRAAPASPS